MLLFCQAPDSVAAVLRLWLLDAEDTSEGHVARVPVASTVVRKKVKCRVLLRALEDEGFQAFMKCEGWHMTHGSCGSCGGGWE